MGQPVCAHANDWAGMIKPNGPVDFYIPMGYDMNGALPPLRWCEPGLFGKCCLLHFFLAIIWCLAVQAWA